MQQNNEDRDGLFFGFSEEEKSFITDLQAEAYADGWADAVYGLKKQMLDGIEKFARGNLEVKTPNPDLKIVN